MSCEPSCRDMLDMHLDSLQNNASMMADAITLLLEAKPGSEGYEQSLTKAARAALRHEMFMTGDESMIPSALTERAERTS